MEIQYKGKNINEILQMTVENAFAFFDSVPVVARKLQTLLDVGLGYITLGQSATTLSGGEAQRVKLSLELSKRDTGRTLYILDEPTTGLHFQDIDLLLKVLHRLRDHGNTVVVIEHNLDVIKTADWIIDLGPEGGDGGGQIIAEGTPESIAANPASVTGQYLRPMLDAASSQASTEASA
jgi:excinuclease ABC subunit A